MDNNYATLFMETISEPNSKSEYKVFLLPLHNCTINVMAKSILLRFMMIFVDFEVVLSEGNSTLPLERKCAVVDYEHFRYYPVKYVLNDIPFRSNLEILVYEFNVTCPKDCNCSHLDTNSGQLNVSKLRARCFLNVIHI